MKRFLASLVFAALVLTASVAVQGEEKPAASAGPMIVHDVYFSLKDASPEAKKKLVDGCKKYLTAHPGTVFFTAGVLATELKRPVNDVDFDVALHIVFTNKAAHDKYAVAERHLKFIEENKENWKKVRVFDSAVEAEKNVVPAKDK
jgi:hypothetical protein